MNTCIDLIDYEEFLEAGNKNTKRIPSYEKYLNELNDEDLLKEWRMNTYLLDYMTYNYDFIKALIMTEIINPCRIASETDHVPYKEPEWKYLEPVKQVDRVLDRITYVRMVADRALDRFEFDPAVPFEHEHEHHHRALVEDCMDYAYEVLKYYYRITQYADRLEFEEALSSHILGYINSEKVTAKLASLPEFFVKECLGVVKDGLEYDYSKRIRAIGNLYEAFAMIDEELY